MDITSDRATDLVPGPIKKDIQVGDHTIPKGSYVASVAQSKMGKHGCDKWKVKVEVDKAWTTEEFLLESEKVVLPWRTQPTIPDRSLRNMVEALELGTEQYGKVDEKD